MKNIDFTKLKHNENTIENQQHFDANQSKFSNQCKIVYEALLRGERLTTETAITQYRVLHLARRIKDLKDFFNIPIQSSWTNGKIKEYYLPQNIN